MAFSAAHRSALTAMHLPADAQVRERLLAFLIKSGLNQTDLGNEIGYSRAAVGHFIQGRYAAQSPNAENSLALRAALKQYMDLHEIGHGIHLTGTHYETESFQQVHAAAMNALRKKVAYIVDGPPGTEKTESLRRIEKKINDSGLGRAIYVYARVKHSPQSFLMECCTAAGIPNRGNIDQLLRKLRFYLSEKQTIFMVDEAQHLNHTGLEVLRQLLDLPPHFGVVLAGSHDLTQRLSHWQMEQWRSRVRKTIYLNGPTKEECRRILRAELGDVMTNEIADKTITSCKSKAQRVDPASGDRINFTYTSARSLFGAIDQTKEILAASHQKAGAA